MADRYELRLPALEIRQGPSRTLYSFAVDGKQLLRFTAVARTHRTETAQIQGYQRPEVQAHIAAIRHYLEAPDPMIPNALVVAFDERVRFEPERIASLASYARFGILIVPIDECWAEANKPGWLVDGQQRAAAIQEATLDEFPICVTAFITGSQQEQRSQFILVNSTKPLPKSLLYELLPATTGRLPDELERRRLPAALLDRLNFDRTSPSAAKSARLRLQTV
jgi:DGQHR domain-containing protein